MSEPARHDAGSREAFLQAFRESIGVPSMVLAAGYLGFGALANGYGFPLWAALLSTASIFALPGQLAMLEMSLSGTFATVIVVTVSLTAARFLPMAVSLMPVVRTPGRPSWHLYLVAQLLAMTGWAAGMRRFPTLPPAQRLPWFVGFAVTNWIVCLAATLAGYGLADLLPTLVRQGLVFVGPLYFLLILTGETRTRQGIAALACGAVVGPLVHLLSPQWSVMLGGFIGGTLAWALVRSSPLPRGGR